MVSPFLYFPGERLSLAELTAACLDGLLTPIGEGFMPADAVETAWMRARSLAPLVGAKWAAVRSSAAWIHGGAGLEPARHHLQRASAERVRPPRNTGVVTHDVRIAPADVVTIAGVLVASPERTLVDLARSADEADVTAARAWGLAEPRLVAEAQRWLARHPRFPYGRRADEVLRTLGVE
ncbi:type IV toxin-antitoxin system AbiEi family antitoxin [Microbacterium sp. NPDC016588]